MTEWQQILKAVIDKAKANKLSFVRLDYVASNNRLRGYYENQTFSLVSVENNGEVDLALYRLDLGTM